MRVYWEKRPRASTHNPHWRTPDQLWEDAVRYFEWASSAPIKEEKVVTAGSKYHHVKVDRVRAFTLSGLCAYLGVQPVVFDTYGAKKEFAFVAEAIRNVIVTQKFEHAAAGLLNANIIMRDLGMADKQELSGRDGGPIQTEEVTNDAAAFASRISGLAARARTPDGTAETPDRD